jgi:hypothetical protein
MNRRHIFIALGFLALSIGLVAPAEAGGRRPPAPKPPAPKPPTPTVTQVTVVNKTAKNLFVQVGETGTLPDKVGAAQAAGAKVINAGATAVFTPAKAGDNDIRATDMALLNNLSIPNQSVADGAYPLKQQGGDFFTVAANKNTTVEITQPNTNAAMLFKVK